MPLVLPYPYLLLLSTVFYILLRVISQLHTQSRGGIRKSTDTVYAYVACVVGDVRNFINTVASLNYHDCIDQMTFCVELFFDRLLMNYSVIYISNIYSVLHLRLLYMCTNMYIYVNHTNIRNIHYLTQSTLHSIICHLNMWLFLKNVKTLSYIFIAVRNIGRPKSFFRFIRK